MSLLEAAAAFYERYLWDSQAGSLARDYLAGRGLDETVCREFRLGLALGGTTLVRKALDKGFTRDELRAAGLITSRGSDYFNGRLLFPLTDARGRILGFQAILLEHGIRATVRWSKGEDIGAACGQLKETVSV